MKNLLKLNSVAILLLFIFPLSTSFATEPVDIWNSENVNKNINNQNQDSITQSETETITINNKIEILDGVNLEIVDTQEDKLVGLYDPEENDLSISMWAPSDGDDIKNTLNRINKLKLSNFSEDLLFRILFTNSLSPSKNFTSAEFLNFKINWLIKKKRISDLEKLLASNPSEVSKNKKVINFLVDEYLSTSDIDSSCEKVELMDREIKSKYLEKFLIYCFIYRGKPDEAILNYEILKETGFKDSFFEDKIFHLLDIKASSNQTIKDDNLLNFFISHITSKEFSYKPSDNTDKYIWKYLSSVNLLNTEDLNPEEEAETITIFEKAVADGLVDEEELFNIYYKLNFNLNQLLNAKEMHKTLPNYKARALIYQKILLSEDIDKKLNLIFLLRDLFEKDKLVNAYEEKMENILQNLDSSEIPDRYQEAVSQILSDKQKIKKNIKYDNDIIHQSKIINYFLEDDYKISKVEKDFKTVFKKVKRNKNYFISIKDIIILNSLKKDGVNLPADLKYDDLEKNLVIPEGLNSLAEENQTGLVLLKIVEIIGEDSLENLDPETIYFVTKILNKLELTKIRNQILIKTIPKRV